MKANLDKTFWTSETTEKMQCNHRLKPLLYTPDVKNWLIWKDPDAEKGWRWEEKGMTEDEMIEWYHWLNCQELE